MKALNIHDYYSVVSDNENWTDSIISTYHHQAIALQSMAENIDVEQYQNALEYMLGCTGHVIICGMGKSGHVGKKISATLASTGTPSFFLHPSEAFHGDLGMITCDDVIVLISNSGETDEVLQLIPSLKLFGNKIISITGKSTSTMSKNSDVTLLLAESQESCPNNLAPTTSTTLIIALGDALAVALMKMRQFQPNDFARFHPGGSLGRRLLTRVRDVMVKEHLPLVDVNDTMTSIVITMNEGRKGVAIVTDNCILKGIITDGDLRRALVSNAVFRELKASDVMTAIPKTCFDTEMLSDAEERMREHAVSSLVVLDDSDKVVGLVQLLNI
ncbi:KpsF/GutQ family sugar-phosphate isomerase [Vibrio rotiferianus]|uniref:KpsF/GutQ family sugar-phosphate isomerase n=1 Tax=Vibrio rotiferianus TaxID=190895 RepID=UPI00406A28BF